MEGEDADVVQSPDQISVISAPVAKPEEPKPEEPAEKPKETDNEMKTLGYCFAIYDYDAEADDELNFEEGQVKYFFFLHLSYNQYRNGSI